MLKLSYINFQFCLQYHRGRAPASEKWVFGLVDTSHEPALGVMELFPSRDAHTLLPIIQQHVRPGTIIWSDEWRAYRRVQNIPTVAQYQTVNHSVTFVDPTTGVHTQNIESYWNRVKTKFKRMKGVHEEMLSSYMDEFMWREQHGQTASTTLQNIMRDIALHYPV
jgi:transposase-like protein